MSAIRHAACGRASTMGTIMASGGTGKIELSRKAMMAKARSACGPAAWRIIQA